MLRNRWPNATFSIATMLGISHTMVHKLIEQGVLVGIKPVLDEKKLGYDWAAFTGLTFEKDADSERVIEALKNIPEITEYFYIKVSYNLYIRMVTKSHSHMREILYHKIDTLPGIAKTDSMVELGCAFKRNIGL